VSLGVISALMVWVVPKLMGIFEQGKRELPLLTKGLIACSEFLQNYGLILIALIVASIWIVKHLLKKPKILRRWHEVQLKLPVLGELSLQVNTSRFAATLSLLTASGVPLLQALNISSQVMSNLVLQESCDQVVASVREGMKIGRAS